jgi:HK97 family phage portal protein
MRKLFERWFAKRGIYLKGFESLRDLYAPATASGVVVTPERALTVPAVYACITTLGQDVAKTPIKMRQQTAPDTYVDATEHPLWEILHSLPNPETTAYTFKLQMMVDLLTYERAYAEIVRVDGRVESLWRLDPTRVVVDRDASRRKRYRYTAENGQTMEWLFDPSRPPILDLTHPSPIRYGRELIGTALALQSYVGYFFSNGARLGGVLQTDKTLSPSAVANIRENFQGFYGGLKKSHSVAVLEEGLKYEAVAADNEAAQLNDTLQTIRTEICGMFHVPTWKVGDLTKATYSNMEAGAQEYVSGALDPFFAVWEYAIRRDLLTTRQYGQYDVLFDRSALVRSDVKSLHEALARGREAGYYSANDVRRKLGENPIPGPGGDVYLVSSNTVPLASAGTPTNGAQ